MPKYFLSGTKYAAFERMMMETPHYRPPIRKSRGRECKGLFPTKKFTEMITTTERSG